MISLLAETWGILGSITDILEGYLLLDASAVLQVRHAVVNIPDLPSRRNFRDMRPSSSPHSNVLYPVQAQTMRDHCSMP